MAGKTDADDVDDDVDDDDVDDDIDDDVDDDIDEDDFTPVKATLASVYTCS